MNRDGTPLLFFFFFYPGWMRLLLTCVPGRLVTSTVITPSVQPPSSLYFHRKGPLLRAELSLKASVVTPDLSCIVFMVHSPSRWVFFVLCKEARTLPWPKGAAGLLKKALGLRKDLLQTSQFIDAIMQGKKERKKKKKKKCTKSVLRQLVPLNLVLHFNLIH